jgi:hypothetical protein
VTATVGSVSGTATVNVVAGSLNSLTITPTAVTLPTGGTCQFDATGFDTYNNTLSDIALLWQVTQPGVGRIDSSGLFTAGPQSGIYLGAVAVSSGVISATADVEIHCQVYQPVIVRPSP